jgi:conserved oligomeric Golgi complex subunit 3
MPAASADALPTTSPTAPASPTKQLNAGLSAMTEMWYPTLPRTLLLLSKLYRSVERGVFEGLAQELVYGCLESLATGYTSISKLKGNIHGQLFLIKHLLILRDQIAPFEGSFSARETNVDFAKFFTGLRSGLQDLVTQRDKLFSFAGDNSFLGFLVNSTPQVLETHSDSRELMDQRLKSVCTEYIQFQIKETCGKLASFLVMVDAMAEAKRTTLGGQTNTAAEKTRAVVVEFDKALRARGGLIKNQLSIYLANQKTEHIIVASIKNGVLDVYQKFSSVVTAGYSPEDIAIISPPTMEQVRMTFG